MTLQQSVVWAMFALMGAGASSAAQQASGEPARAPQACEIDHAIPNAAEEALLGGRYADAEGLYGGELKANPDSGQAMAGLVRTKLGEGKLPEALALAMKYDDAHPNDPRILDALGEVRMRRGEVEEAAVAFNRAAHIDPCFGHAHYDAARFLNLSGMYGSAQRQLELAHALSPADREIASWWRQTHAIPLTAEQRLASLKTWLTNPSITEDEKASMDAAIKGIETREKGDCQLVTPAAEVKLPIIPMPEGVPPGGVYGAALDVEFNGKKKRLKIDTGASGLLLSHSVAKSAGLVSELEIKTGGIGDDGPANAFVTHVDDIKIGSMEFKNCMVRVLEKSNAMNIDGLIGTDVFRDYLVTLDIPGRQVRLSPLPKRPGDQASTVTSLDTASNEENLSSVADSAKDRYVAPEMKDWTRVFRWGHNLIFPTVIGKAPAKLFIMDTGASVGMISPEAAREVTHISNEFDSRLSGINGEVRNLLVADKVELEFGGIRQMTAGMLAFDSAGIARSSGVDIAGLIGFPTLRELIISIDYRDNLVHVVYDPHKGAHTTK